MKFRPFASVKFSHTVRIYFVVSPCIHSVPPIELSYCRAHGVIMPALMKLIGYRRARLFPAYSLFKIHATVSEPFCSPCARANSSTICCADSPPCPYRLNLVALSRAVFCAHRLFKFYRFAVTACYFALASRILSAVFCAINLTAPLRLPFHSAIVGEILPIHAI